MRNKSIDFLRFIAVAFVIVLHVGPWSKIIWGQMLDQVGRFAVPYFFIAAGYFFYKKTELNPNGSITYLIHYGLRLFWIYAFWYAVYALWPLYCMDNWANIQANGFYAEMLRWFKDFLDEFKNHMAYYIAAGGRGYHLWFLPSLGMAICILAIAIRFNVFYLGFALACVLFLMALAMGPYRAWFPDAPFDFDMRNGPFFSSVFVFIGALISRQSVRVSMVAAIAIMVSGLSIHLAEAFYLHRHYGLGINTHNYVAGTLIYSTGVFLMALSNPQMGSRFRIHRLGAYTLGIYVSHVFVIGVMRSGGFWPTSDLLKVVLCLVSSLALTVAMSHIPWLKRIVT